MNDNRKGYKAFKKGLVCVPDEEHVKQYEASPRSIQGRCRTIVPRARRHRLLAPGTAHIPRRHLPTAGKVDHRRSRPTGKCRRGRHLKCIATSPAPR